MKTFYTTKSNVQNIAKYKNQILKLASENKDTAAEKWFFTNCNYYRKLRRSARDLEDE